MGAGRSAIARITELAPTELHDDVPSREHRRVGPEGASWPCGAPQSDLWRPEADDLEEDRSPLVAAVVCAAKLAGVRAQLGAESDDDASVSSEADAALQDELDGACTILSCARLLGIEPARVYPPTAECVAAAIADDGPVIVADAERCPCVLYGVTALGFRAARFSGCVAEHRVVPAADLPFHFGFWCVHSAVAAAAAGEHGVAAACVDPDE